MCRSSLGTKQLFKSVQHNEQFDHFVIDLFFFFKDIYIWENKEHLNLSITHWVCILSIGDIKFPMFYSTLLLTNPQ